MDIDAMSPEELKAKVRELLKQKEEDDATIARLREQIGGMDGGGAATAAAKLDGADPSVAPVKTEQEMAAEMEKQKQAMIDAMLADGTISQEEYEDMMERNRREKEVQQLKARRKKAWNDAKAVWNEKGCKHGMIAIEKNWADIGNGEPFTMAAIAKIFRTESGEPPDKLDLKEVGEFLAGGKPQMAQCRNAFIDTFDFTNNTFVQAMRAFLGSFRMPGESMLIERLMVVFARRYYECNPDYVDLLTVEKTKELKDAFDTFVSKAEGPVTLDSLGPMVRSLGGDLKWMKDDEIEEMTAITVGEFRYVRNLYFKSVGIQPPALSDADMSELVRKIHIAATAARKSSAAEKVVKKLAEVKASLENVGDKYAADDPKLPLETKRLEDQVEVLTADIESSRREAEEAMQAKIDQVGDFELDLITFLTMMAHKMGNDTAFVLAYSAIMLNTDAHNPRLTGQARMSKAVFIESNRRTPDLANLTDMFMGGVYDEIVQKEIEIDAGDQPQIETPKKGKAVADSPRVINVAPSFDIIGQRMYDVQQKNIPGAPKRVKVGVTQMGLSVFDENSVPLSNVIFQTMASWAPDKKERGVVINKVPKGNIYLKTADCVEICEELTANKASLDAAAAKKGSRSTTPPEPGATPEPAPAPTAEEGVPPSAGQVEDASPVVRPPRDDEEQI